MILGRLALLLLVVGCENVRRVSPADAPPPRPAPDAARPAPVDAPPPPPVDAPPPPPAADAGRLPARLDGCTTDADCTTYGDPCGGGLFPVNRRFADVARARAQRRCPGQSMGYLTTLADSEARCVRKRCQKGDALEIGPDFR